jgi:hypothetical protein
MNVEVIPGTSEERKLAFLAFASVLGGGVIALEAVRSIREGDLFKTDEIKEKPTAGLVAYGAGIAMLWVSMNKTAEEYGWKPIVLGSAGITAVALVARAIRR